MTASVHILGNYTRCLRRPDHCGWSEPEVGAAVIARVWP